MKVWAAGLATFVLLALALVAGRRGSPHSEPLPAETPEACIERMFRAAETGNVDAYRDCFTGQQLERLQRAWNGQGREAIAQSIRDSLADLKGHVIDVSAGVEKPLAAPTAGVSTAQLHVELVFAHHNQSQIIDLVQSGLGWQIEAIRLAGNRPPPIPYGTPVFPGIEPSQAEGRDSNAP